MKYIRDNGYPCLTKENFWNDIAVKYPIAFKLFSEWIDNYKIRNNWNHLFKPGIKFHDLPISMQRGIIEQFKYEVYYYYTRDYDSKIGISSEEFFIQTTIHKNTDIKTTFEILNVDRQHEMKKNNV